MCNYCNEETNIIFCTYCGQYLKDKKVYPAVKNDIKQVIVVRKDLKNTQGNKVRTGKLIAQGSHASLKVFFDRMQYMGENVYQIKMTDAMIAWDNASYVKICVGVSSEEELLEVYRKALIQGLPVALIKDNGMTEFGEPTYTCLAIGPDHGESINQITGHLPLY